MMPRTLALAALLGATALAPVGPAHAQEALRLAASDIVAPDDPPKAGESPGAIPLIRIAGARNGSFSGKLLAAAAGPIEDLKAVPGDLKKDGGTIPASAVRIRYGTGWEGLGSFRRPSGLDILLEAPPAKQSTDSIWVTINVPKDAAPGDYAGSITVSAKGAAPRSVPLRLHVADWTLPDTQDYATWLELVQSPDTLSVEYGVPLWSEKHWRMIEQSFDLIGQAGSRVVYAPLICNTNLGNAESMVRWVPCRAAGGARYEFDFTILDRYLDTAEKHMGRPKIVVFNAWDVYQQDKVLAKGEPRTPIPGTDPNALRGGHPTGPAVTVADPAAGGSTAPAAGKTAVRYLPRFSDPNGEALWRPLFDELHKRMARRGLQKAMMLGMFTDAAPTKEETAALKSISGGLPWVAHAHFDPGTRGPDVSEIGYRTIHENVVLTLNPAKGRTFGWKEPDLRSVHFRGVEVDRLTASGARCLLELQITGKQRGLGYIGGDFWAAVKDARGQRVAIVTDRYPQSYWRMIEMRSCLLAPGPEGAVATARYENVREGIQECEARIFLERAIMDPVLRAKLGEDLAGRAQGLLDERQHALWREKGLTDEEIASIGSTVHWWRDLKYDPQQNRHLAGYHWFRASGWQDRSQKLFDLAGDAGRKLAAK